MTNDAGDDLLSIGRFSRLCGLSVGALRHYASFGLLPPARVDPDTGYRTYARSQLEAARLIARLRALEMPLPEIRAAIGLAPAELRAAVARHRTRMEARTVRLQRIVHQLSQEIPMPAKTDDPRRTILEAARALVLEGGHEAASLRQVAARAGYSAFMQTLCRGLRRR